MELTEKPIKCIIIKIILCICKHYPSEIQCVKNQILFSHIPHPKQLLSYI